MDSIDVGKDEGCFEDLAQGQSMVVGDSEAVKLQYAGALVPILTVIPRALLDSEPTPCPVSW